MEMSDNVKNGDSVPCPKLDNLEINNKETVHDQIKDLSQFKLDSILHNNTNRKIVCLKGSFHNQLGDAVVILEKPAFSNEILSCNGKYFTENSCLEKVFHNDVYGDYKCSPVADLNTVKTTIIHPATEKHIQKYSSQQCYMVNETPHIYKNIVFPYISKEKLDLQWVYNILDHKSESERILVEDCDPVNGFVMVPDLKWSGEIDTLYFLAICNRKDLTSIRNLTAEHLPLLNNIRNKGIEAIKTKYGLDGSQLRIYFHYQPSFYHLHIHFTYLKHEAPGILAERAHMLTTVISNLELLPDYYEKVTLPFIVRENDKLFTLLETEGVVKKFDGSV